MSDSDETKVEELPPDETGPVPVTVVHAEPHWFGLTPTGSLLAVGVAAVGVAIVLLAVGSVVAGIVVLAVGVFVLGTLWRRPVAEALAGPVGLARVTVSAQSEARRRLAPLRRELDALEREREQRLRALGEAVYRGDDAATDPLRQELEELDRGAGEKREEIERTVQQASERIGRARLETGRTEAVPVEPYPPPDEADRPAQPEIPEPYPPPDEGDRPEQPSVPGDADRDPQ
ncbi:MAG: hypothetical protein WD067_02130 [Gaiellaceae bacterium]